jgi:general secretion pathway protein D
MDLREGVVMKTRILRYVVGVFVLLLASLASAAPLTLQFTKATLPSFLAVLFGDILQRPYVLAPDLASSQRPVSLNVTLFPERLPAFVSGFLAQQGLTASERDGVTYLALALPGAPNQSAPSQQDQSASALLDAPLPVKRKVLQAPDALDETPQARESSAQSPAPSFARYVPRNLPAQDICAAVAKVFGASSCVDVSGAAHLVHARHLSAVQAFAEAIDAQPATVDLTAVFVEVTGSRRDGFGLSLVASVLGSSLGAQLGTVADTGVITLKGASFQAVLDVLRTDARFRQVASPSGRVDSGKPFSISIGDEVPTLAGQSRDTTGQVTSQVVYRASGVLLNVTPLVVSADGAVPRVVCTVDAQVSSFSATKTGVNSSPTLSKRQVKTQASLSSGEVVLIGGLTGSSDTVQTSGLFGVPLSKRDEAQDTELVLLLSARTVQR